MKLHEVAKAMGFHVVPTEWTARWDAVAQAYDPSRLATLISPRHIDALREPLHMPADVYAACLEHLKLFDDHPALNLLFQVCHQQLYVDEVHDGVSQWPLFKDAVIPGGNMFFAYLALASRDYMHRHHAARGIPDNVTDDTLGDLFVWMQDYHTKRGHWGLDALGWVANYALKCRLIQLGRLQYIHDTFKLPFRGYRHVRTGRVIVLAREGRVYRNDGQFEGENRRLGSEAPWTSELHVTATEIRGHLVHPDGTVLREPRTFAAAEWEVAFDEGSPALGVHIPACGPLDPDACRRSLRQAIDFFPRHFPEKGIDVVWCYSWLMDAQLKAYLPESSNIIQFQNEFYLAPFPNTSGWQTFERVFGSSTPDLSRVEAKNTLQRAVLEHIRRGGAWRCPAGVIFPSCYQPGAPEFRTRAWQQDLLENPLAAEAKA